MDSDDVRVSEGAVSRVERASSLVKDWQIPLALVLICVTALIVSGRWSIPEAPGWVEQMLQVAAVGIIPSTLLGKLLIVDKFLPDSRLDVLEIEVEDGMTLTPHKCPGGVWKDRETGKYAAFQPPRGVFDHVVTRFDWDDDDEILTVEGCNPEIADPASIMARNGLLKETYGDLQDDRAELSELRATLQSKALRIDQQNVNDLMEAVEHGGRFGSSAWDEIRSDEWSEEIEPDAEERDRAGRSEVEDDDRPTLSDLVDAGRSGLSGSSEASADD